MFVCVCGREGCWAIECFEITKGQREIAQDEVGIGIGIGTRASYRKPMWVSTEREIELDNCAKEAERERERKVTKEFGNNNQSESSRKNKIKKKIN